MAGRGVTLGGGFPVPGEGPRIVLRHTVTVRIEDTKIGLGLGVPLGGGMADALKRLPVAVRRLLEEGRPQGVSRMEGGRAGRHACEKTEHGYRQPGSFAMWVRSVSQGMPPVLHTPLLLAA